MATKRPLGQRLILPVIAVVLITILGSLTFVATGRTQEEAQKMELRSVQQAVSIMMVDNGIPILPNPVVLPTSDMSLFPDATTPPEVKDLLQGDRPGYVLHGHDKTRDAQPEPTVDYIRSSHTTWTYTVTRAGLVRQEDKATKG